MNGKFNEEVFKSIVASDNSYKEKFRLIDETYFALSKKAKEEHEVEIMHYVDLLRYQRNEDYAYKEIKKFAENKPVAFKVLKEIHKRDYGRITELFLIGDIKHLELEKAIKILLAYKLIEVYSITNELYYVESPKGIHALNLITTEATND